MLLPDRERYDGGWLARLATPATHRQLRGRYSDACRLLPSVHFLRSSGAAQSGVQSGGGAVSQQPRNKTPPIRSEVAAGAAFGSACGSPAIVTNMN